VGASWRRLVALSIEELHVRRRVTVVAGDVAESRDRPLGVRSNQVVHVALQRMEDCDEDMNVVDTNAHLKLKKYINKNVKKVSYCIPIFCLPTLFPSPSLHP